MAKNYRTFERLKALEAALDDQIDPVDCVEDLRDIARCVQGQLDRLPDIELACHTLLDRDQITRLHRDLMGRGDSLVTAINRLADSVAA